MTRSDILSKADQCVNGQREEDYGTPEDSFQDIADLWTSYVGLYEFSPCDVANMLILMKIARSRNGFKHADNWIDIAGYAACAGEIGTKGIDVKKDFARVPDCEPNTDFNPC